MPSRAWCALALAFVSCAILAGCERDIAAKPPFQAITRSGNDLTFQLIEGATLAQVVSLDLFEGFSPGMTPREAESSMGPPIAKGTEGNAPDSIFFSEFQRPHGKVRVYEEHIVGQDDGDGWWLEGIPDAAPLERLVVASVLEQVPDQIEAQVDWKLYLYTSDKRFFVTLNVHAHRVNRISWLKR